MRNKIALFLLTALAAQASSGCMTILRGSTQKVPVVSYPVSTAIRIVDENGSVAYEGPTPAEVTLNRSHDYKITASAPGFRPTTVNVVSESSADTIWACILINMIGSGGLGWFIDPFTGSLRSFDEEGIEVSMLRNKQAQVLPSDVHVRFEGELLSNGTATVHPSAAKH